MRTMINNRTNGNVYKQEKAKLTMSKKEVSITLDEAVLIAIDSFCKDNHGVKRSTFINNVLKNNSEIKKRLKKHGISNRK